MVWKAKTVWYGERGAAAKFQNCLTSKLEVVGAKPLPADPTKFVLAERGLYIETHVDDGHVGGSEDAIVWLYTSLVDSGLDLKPLVVQRIGMSYRYLRRIFSRLETGMLIEGNPKYIQDTIIDLGLSAAKGVTTPMVPGNKKLLKDAEGCILLEVDDKRLYGKCVMRLMYVTNDRPDIMFTVRYLSKTVSRPTRECMAKLKRLGRYLVYRQRVAVLIPVAGGDLSLQEAQSDSDWASDVETRKSVSCGSLMVGGASQGFFVRGQATLSTSSAEAEFLGAGSTTNEAFGLKELYAEFGFAQTLILQLDSGAAIGMCHRRGLGRVRHLDVRFLQLQELLREIFPFLNKLRTPRRHLSPFQAPSRPAKF